MAKKDIRAGEKSWPAAIMRALSSCRSMVLVCSRNSMGSDEVSKELTIAVGKKIPIVPFRIEDIRASDELAYHLANTQWMDAFPGDVRQFVPGLHDVVRSLLAGGQGLPPQPVETQSIPSDAKTFCVLSIIFSAVGAFILPAGIVAIVFGAIAMGKLNVMLRSNAWLWVARVGIAAGIIEVIVILVAVMEGFNRAPNS
jgi:hypothetical protein